MKAGYTGHDPVHTGLQSHSVGGIYPLIIVGIANGATVHFEIHHALTGRALESSVYHGQPAVFNTADLVGNAAEIAHKFPALFTWVERVPFVPVPKH